MYRNICTPDGAMDPTSQKKYVPAFFAYFYPEKQSHQGNLQKSGGVFNTLYQGRNASLEDGQEKGNTVSFMC